MRTKIKPHTVLSHAHHMVRVASMYVQAFDHAVMNLIVNPYKR